MCTNLNGDKSTEIDWKASTELIKGGKRHVQIDTKKLVT